MMLNFKLLIVIISITVSGLEVVAIGKPTEIQLKAVYAECKAIVKAMISGIDVKSPFLAKNQTSLKLIRSQPLYNESYRSELTGIYKQWENEIISGYCIHNNYYGNGKRNAFLKECTHCYFNSNFLRNTFIITSLKFVCWASQRDQVQEIIMNNGDNITIGFGPNCHVSNIARN